MVFRRPMKFRPRRYRKGKKALVKKAIRKVKASAFKKKVLQVIKSQVETKQAYLTQTPIDFNSGINASGDCLKIIPNITRGSADNNRIGDQIRAQKINIRAILQMLPQGNNQAASVCKLACRVMIVTPKGYPNWATASANTATWMPTLLKKGGTVTSFTGDISDLYAPGNTDAITFHYNKVHYFNQPWATSTASSIALDQSHLVKFLKINLKCRNRLVKYDDNTDSGLTPTNLGYFMLVGYAFVDGTAPDTLSTRVRLQYDAIFDYEDA